MGGFFDAEGNLSLDNNNYLLSISFRQRTKELLIPLQLLYGGNISIDRSSNSFILYITKKENILFLLDNYFKKSYFFSQKRQRIHLIPKYYELIELKKKKNIMFLKC
jgi:hypothetical protein